MSELYNYIDEETIKLLVDRFYDNVRQDKELSLIFDDAIGTDEESWKPHLERMYAFWSSIMLKTGRFHGTPMQKHQELPAFDLKLFQNWLVLFEDTVSSLHTDDIAQKYKEISTRIAQSLKLGIENK